MNLLLPALVAFAVAAGLTSRFCNPASRLHILDHPSERSLHNRPIPRSGGVAVLGGLLAGGLLMGVVYPVNLEEGFLVLAALILAGVSFLDDRYTVNQGVRIAVHFAAAVLLLTAGYGPAVLELPGMSWVPPAFLMFPVLTMFVVWMINLYNFMDGMDGFAGGMAVLGFASFAILGAWSQDGLFASASLTVATAVAGFLRFNFPPARIFLGDTGSSVLGFLAAAFSLWGARDGLFPLWLAVLVFSPFIVDATVTLGRRLIRGERVWLPHKTHYYQRLVQMGWGHRGTVLAEYCLMLLCGLSALLAVRLSVPAQLGLMALWVFIYVCLLVGVDCLERRRIKAETR